MDVQAGEVTEILRSVAAGKTAATDRLLPLVYDILRKIAAQQMKGQPAGLTLQATALVNEAYLRLFTQDEPSWSDRGHFYAAAAQAMREILVDQARRKGRIKHGGDRKRIELPPDLQILENPLVIAAASIMYVVEFIDRKHSLGLPPGRCPQPLPVSCGRPGVDAPRDNDFEGAQGDGAGAA